MMKYVVTANVSHAEVMGNMDAYLNNANDWSYQKMEEKKGAPSQGGLYHAQDETSHAFIHLGPTHYAPYHLSHLQNHYSILKKEK